MTNDLLLSFFRVSEKDFNGWVQDEVPAENTGDIRIFSIIGCRSSGTTKYRIMDKLFDTDFEATFDNRDVLSHLQRPSRLLAIVLLNA